LLRRDLVWEATLIADRHTDSALIDTLDYNLMRFSSNCVGALNFISEDPAFVLEDLNDRINAHLVDQAARINVASVSHRPIIQPNRLGDYFGILKTRSSHPITTDAINEITDHR
jgi:hypothetical protein